MMNGIFAIYFIFHLDFSVSDVRRPEKYKNAESAGLALDLARKLANSDPNIGLFNGKPDLAINQPGKLKSAKYDIINDVLAIYYTPHFLVPFNGGYRYSPVKSRYPGIRS